MKIVFTTLLLVITSIAGQSKAAEIEVQGLFGRAAVLVIDGKREMMKVGDTRSGVRLVSADSEKAVIEYEGEQQTVYLSEHIGSSFQAPGRARVMITVNDNRQYFTAGTINGRSVQFLVDTGANVISIGGNLAASLGISTEGGNKGYATTAGGRTEVTHVTLKTVQVGEITQHNVGAIVSHAQNAPYVLLGMTFLQHVDISENAGLMVLTSKL